MFLFFYFKEFLYYLNWFDKDKNPNEILSAPGFKHFGSLQPNATFISVVGYQELIHHHQMSTNLTKCKQNKEKFKNSLMLLLEVTRL